MCRKALLQFGGGDAIPLGHVLPNSQYAVKTAGAAAQIVLPFRGGASVEVGLAFGKVLRRRRVEAGFTQEQLALEAALQRNYVSLMERGINQPTITTLIKLATPLGCTAAEIVEEVERLVADQRSTPVV